MKFDVLKGLVDKSMTRTADSGVVEDTDSSEKMDSLQQNLEQTFTKLTKA